MITAKDVENAMYVSGDGYIMTHGEFYLEPRYAPHFWDRVEKRQYSKTERDPEGKSWAVCIVTDEERAEYNELQVISSVGVRKEPDGVCTWTRSWLYSKEPVRGKMTPLHLIQSTKEN